MSTLINKPANQWSNEEIFGWAEGTASPTGKASNKTVAKEAVARFGLEASDDTRYVKQQLLAEKAGAETAQEPEPGAQNEETPVVAEEAAPEVQEEPVVVEAPVTEVIVEAAVVETLRAVVVEPKPQVPVVKSQTEMKIEIVEQRLAEYAKGMSPATPVSPERGAALQANLYRAILLVLQQEGGDFTNMYTRLLDFVATHRKTLFNERYAYRFFEQMRLSAVERKNFERVLNLLIATCEKSTRQLGLKQVDLQRTLEGFRDGNIQQRVTEYYTV